MSTNYKSYSHINNITGASLYLSDDGINYIYSETVEYLITAEDYATLETDLQNQRDAEAAYDSRAKLAEIDAEISAVDSAKSADEATPVDVNRA